MKKYIFLLKQMGNGCDYTIGCGKTWVELEANSLSDAIITFAEEYGVDYNDDRSLDYLKIVKVNEIITWNNPEFLTEEELDSCEELAERLRKAKDKVEKVKKENQDYLKNIVRKKLELAHFIQQHSLSKNNSLNGNEAT